jgi:hypothetical protein
MGEERHNNAQNLLPELVLLGEGLLVLVELGACVGNGSKSEKRPPTASSPGDESFG